MANFDPPLPHLIVGGRTEARVFHRSGGGEHSIRTVNSFTHGEAVKSEFVSALEEADSRRAEVAATDEELRALGSIIVIDGFSAEFPLKVESLDRFSTHRVKLPMWLLLNLRIDTEGVEHATIWINDLYRAKFQKLFEDYATLAGPSGHALNRELIANMSRIRLAVIEDLWRSDGEPDRNGSHWWEIWLTRDVDEVGTLRTYSARHNLEMAQRVMVLRDRTVVWVRATWDQLLPLPFSAVPIAEIRRPEFVDSVEDLTAQDQDELVEDLVSRLVIEYRSDVAVCLLDTGVRQSHRLLAESLSPTDLHTVVTGSIDDLVGHGTQMAGLALFGDSLDAELAATGPIRLKHRLESVKLFGTSTSHDESTYGLVTAQAVALPEISEPERRRVFSLPITAEPDAAGEPTLWSSSIDALSMGVAISESASGIGLVDVPDPSAARLFIISAGNISVDRMGLDHHSVSDSEPIQDPAQAWNALTVGAFTNLVDTPSDPSFDGWTSLAAAGDLSPHSRTSVLFSHRTWPIKPDICMEGGNVLTNGAGDFHEAHSAVSLRTTGTRSDMALTSANATSAATAQAARLAALTIAHYPNLWPETVRGLLTHGAQWTAPMRAQYDGAASKTQKLSMVRRFGWGVPTESEVIHSSSQAVTMITEDSFVPFSGDDFVAREFRLHRLPWPSEVLRSIGDDTVTLRITLSYFVEPAASRRGWRKKFTYPSHGLRFEMKAPLEAEADFIARINRDAQDEEAGRRPSGASDRWLIGPNQRNLGSLHQDVWEGSGSDLAASDLLAVNPVGGWWKNNRARDRLGLPVRYALIVSLRTETQGVDLYAPVAAALEVPVALETPVPV